MTVRRRLWPLLTAALIGLPVLYVLSHGPWWFILNHHRPPPFICRVGDAFYSPIWSLYYGGMIPDDLFEVFMDYNSWWAYLGGEPPGTIEPKI